MLTVKQVSEICYRMDPLGLARMGAPPAEYDNEAEDLLKLLEQLDCLMPTPFNWWLSIVHAVFQSWFGFTTAGHEKYYVPLAKELLRVWQEDWLQQFGRRVDVSGSQTATD